MSIASAIHIPPDLALATAGADVPAHGLWDRPLPRSGDTVKVEAFFRDCIINNRALVARAVHEHVRGGLSFPASLERALPPPSPDDTRHAEALRVHHSEPVIVDTVMAMPAEVRLQTIASLISTLARRQSA